MSIGSNGPADAPSSSVAWEDAVHPDASTAERNPVDFWPLIPWTAPPSEYDYRNAAMYLRLLMAEANGAAEHEIARDVFLHVKARNRRLAHLAACSHLKRAHWLFENGFLPLLWALDD